MPIASSHANELPGAGRRTASEGYHRVARRRALDMDVVRTPGAEAESPARRRDPIGRRRKETRQNKKGRSLTRAALL